MRCALRQRCIIWLFGCLFGKCVVHEQLKCCVGGRQCANVDGGGVHQCGHVTDAVVGMGENRHLGYKDCVSWSRVGEGREVTGNLDKGDLKLVAEQERVACSAYLQATTLHSISIYSYVLYARICYLVLTNYLERN